MRPSLNFEKKCFQSTSREFSDYSPSCHRLEWRTFSERMQEITSQQWLSRSKEESMISKMDDLGSMTNCMNSSLRLCRIFGIEIHIHVLMPLFFIGSLVSFSFDSMYFHSLFITLSLFNLLVTHPL